MSRVIDSSLYVNRIDAILIEILSSSGILCLIRMSSSSNLDSSHILVRLFQLCSLFVDHLMFPGKYPLLLSILSIVCLLVGLMPIVDNT